MNDETLDRSNINKLIPEIFDQMRSNLSIAPSTKGARPFLSQKATSSITTQSLLEESKSLDKIIPVIQKLERSLSTSGPQHLRRIKKTCESSNKILDTWIKIQSQAGYAYELMSDESYLEYVTAAQKDESLTPEAFIRRKQAHVDDLRQSLEKEQRLLEESNVEQDNRQTKEMASLQRVGRGLGTKRVIRGGMKRPTGIPRSTTRITKAPVSRVPRSAAKRSNP